MRLLSRASVAKRLDISTKTLDRWVDAGEFPAPTHMMPGKPNSSPERWVSGVVEAWQFARQHTPIPAGTTPVPVDAGKPVKA